MGGLPEGGKETCGISAEGGGEGRHQEAQDESGSQKTYRGCQQEALGFIPSGQGDGGEEISTDEEINTREKGCSAKEAGGGDQDEEAGAEAGSRDRDPGAGSRG